MNKGQLFEQILNEYAYPLSNPNEELFKMIEVPDGKREVPTLPEKMKIQATYNPPSKSMNCPSSNPSL